MVIFWSRSFQEHFLKEALAMDPTWPGDRVDLALRQIARARQVGHSISSHGCVKDILWTILLVWSFTSIVGSLGTPQLWIHDLETFEVLRSWHARWIWNTEGFKPLFGTEYPPQGKWCRRQISVASVDFREIITQAQFFQGQCLTSVFQTLLIFHKPLTLFCHHAATSWQNWNRQYSTVGWTVDSLCHRADAGHFKLRNTQQKTHSVMHGLHEFANFDEFSDCCDNDFPWLRTISKLTSLPLKVRSMGVLVKSRSPNLSHRSLFGCSCKSHPELHPNLCLLWLNFSRPSHAMTLQLGESYTWFLMFFATVIRTATLFYTIYIYIELFTLIYLIMCKNIFEFIYLFFKSQYTK